MARRGRLRLTLDERTGGLDDEALFCRAYGHKWVAKPLTEARLRESLKSGVIDRERFCENGCGSEWHQTLDADDFTVIGTKRIYPKSGYLIEPGNGRLPSNEARKTEFARSWPQFA